MLREETVKNEKQMKSCVHSLTILTLIKSPEDSHRFISHIHCSFNTELSLVMNYFKSLNYYNSVHH